MSSSCAISGDTSVANDGGSSTSSTDRNATGGRARCTVAESERETSAADCCAVSNNDSRFACHICFEEVTEPVVTKCGHLYCWPCLFQWLEPGLSRSERESLGMSVLPYNGDPSRRQCPVCKSECPLSSIIPVYVRARLAPSSNSNSKETNHANNSNNNNNNKSNNREEEHIIDGIESSNNTGSGANDPENDATTNNSETSNEPAATEGGLRRRRTRDPSNNNHNGTTDVPVPNRPTFRQQQHHEPPPEPSSPPSRGSTGLSPQAGTVNSYRVGGLQIAPRSPNGHNASLTHGILSSLQRATVDYYRNTNSNSNSNNNTNTNHRPHTGSGELDREPDRRRIPSLHDRNRNGTTGRFGGEQQQQQHPDDVDYDYRHDQYASVIDVNAETTQYLSRLLIMFTSFVMFCFLLV